MLPVELGCRTVLWPSEVARIGETSKPGADFKVRGKSWNPEDQWSRFARPNLPRRSALYHTLGLETTKSQES